MNIAVREVSFVRQNHKKMKEFGICICICQFFFVSLQPIIDTLMKHKTYSLLFLAFCGIVLLAPSCKSDGPGKPSEQPKSDVTVMIYGSGGGSLDRCMIGKGSKPLVSASFWLRRPSATQMTWPSAAVCAVHAGVSSRCSALACDQQRPGGVHG